MPFRFEAMSPPHAAAIAGWRYAEPYAFYDSPPGAERALLDPANRYFAVTDGGSGLVGFCCFGMDARVPGGAYADDALDVGLGLRPELTGQGLGPAFFAAILEFGRERFRPPAFRLTVAAFNHRAIQVYEGAGFVRTGSFLAEIRGQPHEFITMLHVPAP